MFITCFPPVRLASRIMDFVRPIDVEEEEEEEDEEEDEEEAEILQLLVPMAVDDDDDDDDAGDRLKVGYMLLMYMGR